MLKSREECYNDFKERKIFFHSVKQLLMISTNWSNLVNIQLKKQK